MKRLISWAVILSVLGFTYCVTAQETQKQAETPVYQDGEVWQFKVDTTNYAAAGTFSNLLHGVYDVSFQGGEIKTYEVHSAERIEFIDTLGMLHAMFGKGNWHGGQFLSFPLFVGKKWNYQYHAPLLGGRSQLTYNVEVSVLRVQKVSTPSETLEAFRIQNRQLYSDSFAPGGGPTSLTITYYYSPKTKSLVKLFFPSRTGSGSGGKADIELVRAVVK